MSRTMDQEKRLLDKKILCEHRFDADGTMQFGQGGQQMNQQKQERPHDPDATGCVRRGKTAKLLRVMIGNNNSPGTGAEESMFKHILLPTDGSELSERVVLAAIEFARSISAQVSAIHVASSPEQLGRETKERPKGILDFVEGTAKDYGVPCECLYVTGDHPFEEIVKTAVERGCDLIWMASHGRKSVAELLLGSETSKVLTHSTIPVLVWR